MRVGGDGSKRCSSKHRMMGEGMKIGERIEKD